MLPSRPGYGGGARLPGEGLGATGPIQKDSGGSGGFPRRFGRAGELSGRRQGRGRAPTRTARHSDTYSDGDIGLDGDLVPASCKENRGLVRGCRPLRRRRRQREGAEAEVAVFPTGCRPRWCSGLGRAGSSFWVGSEDG
jgi:hypothetical protein